VTLILAKSTLPHIFELFFDTDPYNEMIKETIDDIEFVEYRYRATSSQPPMSLFDLSAMINPDTGIELIDMQFGTGTFII
jgi:hypothetical protein